MPEEKLQYGFRKVPVYQPNVKKVVAIPEEKLWTCDQQILELKPATAAIEASEEELVSEEEEQIEEPNYLGYTDIGFLPAKNRDAKFIVRRIENEPEAACADPLPKQELGDCGFQLGEIVNQDDVRSSGDCGCSQGFESILLDRLRRSQE